MIIVAAFLVGVLVGVGATVAWRLINVHRQITDGTDQSGLPSHDPRGFM